jgi:hypothetical protein
MAGDKMTNRPIRIQRRRIKGWKMPPNTVYVGRPTAYGNPFYVPRHGDAAKCVSDYRKWIKTNYDESQIEQLRGRNLACWCPLDKPCHADVLLEVANAERI